MFLHKVLFEANLIGADEILGRFLIKKILMTKHSSDLIGRQSCNHLRLVLVCSEAAIVVKILTRKQVKIVEIIGSACHYVLHFLNYYNL